MIVYLPETPNPLQEYYVMCIMPNISVKYMIDVGIVVQEENLCSLKTVLSRAQVAPLFSEAELLVQFVTRVL